MLDSTRLICICAITGAIAALLYFRGLWWTVRGMAGARHPLALYALSVGLRMSGIAAGALVIVPFGWQAVVAALAGFLIVRIAITRAIGLPTEFGATQKLGSRQ